MPWTNCEASLSSTYLGTDPDASSSSLALAGTADRRQQLKEKAGNNCFDGPAIEDDIPLLRLGKSLVKTQVFKIRETVLHIIKQYLKQKIIWPKKLKLIACGKISVKS